MTQVLPKDQKQLDNISRDIRSHASLMSIAYAFMILTTIIFAIFIITLAWFIPMTLNCKRKINCPNESTIFFGICSIIFTGLFGIIAGVIMLIANRPQLKKYSQAQLSTLKSN